MPANTPFHPKPSKSEKPSGHKVGGPSPVEPVREELAAEMDDFIKGWHDSSFELRRGLWVIETDLDPAITHGVVPKNKQGHGGGR